MAVNQKAVKVLNKIFEAGFTDEKAIAAMTMDDILSMQGITVAEIGIINDLQKSIKANKVITFLGGGAECTAGGGFVLQTVRARHFFFFFFWLLYAFFICLGCSAFPSAFFLSKPMQELTALIT